MTELPIVVNMTVDASRTEYDLTAESNLEEIELLNDTVIETGGSHVPVYEGPYTVDAGLSAVTLDTDGKRLTQDVTVNALTENQVTGNELTLNSTRGRVVSLVSISRGYNPTVFGVSKELQLSTQARATITPTASEQTAVERHKYTLGAVKVRAMPTGTRGTPTATKGTVSNHSVSVTPSVTNTTGYITGSTINGTAVSVSASELVSGKKEITANGDNIDVTNYETVKVDVSGGETYYVVSSSGCIYPKKLNQTLSGFNTQTYGTHRWRYCAELEEVNVTGFNSAVGGQNAEAFSNCTKLKKVILPSFTSCGTYLCRQDTALEEVQLGSIGKAVTALSVYTFYGCTKQGLTITIYVADDKTIPLANSPWGATNATIIYKSSTSGEVRTV